MPYDFFAGIIDKVQLQNYPHWVWKNQLLFKKSSDVF